MATSKQRFADDLRALRPKVNDYDTPAAQKALRDIDYVFHLLALSGRDATTEHEAREVLLHTYHELYWRDRRAQLRIEGTIDEALPTMLSLLEHVFPELALRGREQALGWS